jgi:hypothetical protein
MRKEQLRNRHLPTAYRSKPINFFNIRRWAREVQHGPNKITNSLLSPTLVFSSSSEYSSFSVSFISHGENCKFGTPNVTLRDFAILNIDLTKLGLETLSSCKPCH